MTCPEDIVLAEWMAGGLDEAARPVVAAHVRECPRCCFCAGGLEPWSGEAEEEASAWESSPLRLNLLERALAPSSPVRRRRLAPWAVAAALLLAFWILHAAPAGRGSSSSAPEGEAGGRPLPAAPAPSGPVLTADAGDREILFGCSALLHLKGGSRASVLPDGSLRLEAGAVLAEEPGESLFRVGPAQIQLKGGRLLMEREPSPGATAGLSCLAEAWAGAEPAWRLLLCEGSARILLQDRWQDLTVGQEVRDGTWWAGTAWTPRMDGDGWQAMGGLPARRGEGIQTVAPALPEPYECEAVFRRGAATGVSLRLALAGGDIEVPLGGALVKAGRGWVRIRVRVEVGTLSLRVGQEEVLHCAPREALGRYGTAPGGGPAGLHCWGGDLEVASARWRRGPSS